MGVPCSSDVYLTIAARFRCVRCTKPCCHVCIAHSWLSVVDHHVNESLVLETQLNLCAPVGVDKRSVDAWMQPTQFRMHVSTGAPPDMFATQGQNWGFPTYQWSEMEKDGYSFWRRRLTHMSQ